MKLEKKCALAARALNVGKERIIFNQNRLAEIKEAITRQDIKDLLSSGAIIVKEKKGRLSRPDSKQRRRAGSVRKKVNKGKTSYVRLTRKLRSHLAGLKRQDKISQLDFVQLRKEIKTRHFRSLSHMKEYLSAKLSEKTHDAKNTKAKKKGRKN